jgi:hypothetical protein
MKAEIKLTKPEVEQIVRDHIERTLKQKVTSVRFDISPGYEDRFESSSPTLREAIVLIDLEVSVGPPPRPTPPPPPPKRIIKHSGPC